MRLIGVGDSIHSAQRLHVSIGVELGMKAVVIFTDILKWIGWSHVRAHDSSSQF